MLNKLLIFFDSIIRIWPSDLGGFYLRYIFWKDRFDDCGGMIFLGNQTTITNFPGIRIGQDVNIMSGSFLYAHDGGSLIIGKQCSLNYNVLLGAAGGQITIGNNVLIGPNVVLRAANHKFDRTNSPIIHQGHDSGSITIGDDVWIGANVVVTSNVTIGSGCVVGAGSVVTGDLPPLTVCFGNPARPIRSRLTIDE